MRSLDKVEDWHDHRQGRAVEQQLRVPFGHQYFRRAWVIQEVALARKVHLLVNKDRAILTPLAIHRFRRDVRVGGATSGGANFLAHSDGLNNRSISI
jgi:hypothetical protein